MCIGIEVAKEKTIPVAFRPVAHGPLCGRHAWLQLVAGMFLPIGFHCLWANPRTRATFWPAVADLVHRVEWLTRAHGRLWPSDSEGWQTISVAKTWSNCQSCRVNKNLTQSYNKETWLEDKHMIMYVCIWVYTYTYTCMCIYIYIYIYI